MSRLGFEASHVYEASLRHTNINTAKRIMESYVRTRMEMQIDSILDEALRGAHEAEVEHSRKVAVAGATERVLTPKTNRSNEED